MRTHVRTYGLRTNQEEEHPDEDRGRTDSWKDMMPRSSTTTPTQDIVPDLVVKRRRPNTTKHPTATATTTTTATATAPTPPRPHTALDRQNCFRPMLRHVRGSTREFIHRKYLSQVTLGRTHPRHVSLKTCVHVPTFTAVTGSGPKPVTREDWIATHVLDFFNEISIVYGTVAQQCTITTCACMSAGPRYTYKWADGNVVTTPIKLPASEYIRLLLEWVQEQIENTHLFPVSPASSSTSTSSTSSAPPAYPQPDFDRTIQHIFKRLFRVYAHVYHSHYPYICSINVDRALNACFARFCWFIHVWELVDARQLAPLKDVMEEIMLKSDGGRRGKGSGSSGRHSGKASLSSPTGRTNKP